MDQQTIIRAWKDPSYRDHLSPEQRAALPDCPSGRPLTELDDEELAGAVGGAIGLYPDPDGGGGYRYTITLKYTITTTLPTTSPIIQGGGTSYVLGRGGLVR